MVGIGASWTDIPTSCQAIDSADLTKLATPSKIVSLGGKNPLTLQFFAMVPARRQIEEMPIYSSDNTIQYTPVG